MKRGQTLGERRALIQVATGRWGSPDAETRQRIEGLTDGAQIEAALQRLFVATGWKDLLD